MLKHFAPALAVTGLLLASSVAVSAQGATATAMQIAAADPAATADQPKVTKKKLHHPATAKTKKATSTAAQNGTKSSKSKAAPAAAKAPAAPAAAGSDASKTN